MSAGDDHDLALAARWLGRLLVRELDATTLTAMQAEPLRDCLATLGIAVPAAADVAALAAEWCECFLHPPGWHPPVASLWLHGQYDGDAKAAIAAIARAGGCNLAAGARGAPVDHVGCILALWAELVGAQPVLADRLRRQHLAWAKPALTPIARHGGFYGGVAAAAIRLVDVIVAV